MYKLPEVQTWGIVSTSLYHTDTVHGICHYQSSPLHCQTPEQQPGTHLAQGGNACSPLLPPEPGLPRQQLQLLIYTSSAFRCHSLKLDCSFPWQELCALPPRSWEELQDLHHTWAMRGSSLRSASHPAILRWSTICESYWVCISVRCSNAASEVSEEQHFEEKLTASVTQVTEATS